MSISSGRDGSKTHICGITTCTARIYELFELMVSHQVTPVSAMDIVEDWLAY
ncbi:MAG: DUF6514 family protein [Oscillospiraceae bacterium]|nr:DUF6514 family protein [Oscillospiraceae bacterium]